MGLSRTVCEAVKGRLRSKNANLAPTSRGSTWDFITAIGVQETRMMSLTDDVSLTLLGVYTFRLSDRPVGPTGLSDWSVRRSYRVNASSDRSDRRSEESNMFDFVRLPIRLSKRVDTTSDWSDRLASRTTNHAAAYAVAYVIAT